MTLSRNGLECGMEGRGKGWECRTRVGIWECGSRDGNVELG